MSATVPASTTVETATTMKSAATTSVEATSTVESASAASEPAANRSASEPAPSSETAATETTSAEAAASVESATAVKAVEPRTGADKDPAIEPVRAVVAVGRTSVWVIPVVAVGAGCTGAYIDRANANRNLRMRRHGRREHANCQ
jgi:hypothetical protein